MPWLADRVAIVTGGSEGLGWAIARRLATEGASVVIANRNRARGQYAAAQIANDGSNAMYVYVDVTSSSSVKELIQITAEHYGGLDILVNSAGILGAAKEMLNYDDDEWQTVLATNVTGTWLAMRYAIPILSSSKHAAIVNVASVVALVGFPKLSAYSASKGAVLSLTRAAAVEFASAGIRVNAVCPGSIESPMLQSLLGTSPGVREQLLRLHPIGRFGRPSEVAAAVAWLASDESSFITGLALPLAGGWEIS